MKAALALAGFAAVWCAASATTLAHARSLAGTRYLADRTDGAFARFAPHLAGKHPLTVAMGWQVIAWKTKKAGRSKRARKERRKTNSPSGRVRR